MALRIAFGDFEIDEARFELRRKGEPVVVQPKVLELIVYLARHRERVVTKDELLGTVWEGVSVTDASLTQAASLARRALDDTPEAQHTIRTIRSKGLRFVAAAGGAAARHSPSKPPRDARPAAARPAAPRATTMTETAQEDAPAAAPRGEAPYLFAVLHCESPEAGGASWSLADVDEVELVRGSERRTEREDGLTRALVVTLPGRLLSRQHARIVRTPGEWVVIDEGSRNGTFVNGERIRKHKLMPGDVIECGRTLLRFGAEPLFAGVGPDADSRALASAILPTVTPRLVAMARDLERTAASDLPIVLLGQSGVGKTHVAHAVHRLSGRSGPLITLDLAAATGDESPTQAGASSFERARSGTLLIENLQAAAPAALVRVASALEAAEDVRLVCTRIGPAAEFEARVPPELRTRLSGFRCELPPLRDRPGDLGVLVGCLLQAAGRPGPEIDVVAGRSLVRHGWPGNLRELARTLELGATLSSGAAISVEHLPAQIAR